MDPKGESSDEVKKERIYKITTLYYSKPEVQKAIFEFSRNREICPRYFDGFGKRPDSFQYPGDVFELARKGATSFHCSEEIWEDPLKIKTGMSEQESNSLRIGWDLLIDIDSKYIDYSKIFAELIIKILKFHGVTNIGIKFSGSKGFHIIIPWKAFPKEVNGVRTSERFPEWPRIILKYLTKQTEKELLEKITQIMNPNKYVRDFQAPKEVIPDMVLVSPRHLFRVPYSLHEKTALASVVLEHNEIATFQLKDADPLKIKIKNFLPNSKEGEAKELLIQALDWNKEQDSKEVSQIPKNFEQIRIVNLSDKNFPPCIKMALLGLKDGRKRALFVLINFFRMVGLEKDELEKRIDEWNKKNQKPLDQSYVKTQISWSLKRKPIMPQNCKEFYQGIGVCVPEGFCNKIKNPVNYTIRKSFRGNNFSDGKN